MTQTLPLPTEPGDHWICPVCQFINKVERFKCRNGLCLGTKPGGRTHKPAQSSSIANERVHFRLINPSCCGTLLCWVNPRLPNYCPECGTMIISRVKEHILVSDEQATLRTTKPRP